MAFSHTALNYGIWSFEALTDPRLADVNREGIPAEVVIIDLQVHSMGGMAIIRAISGSLPGLPSATNGAAPR